MRVVVAGMGSLREVEEEWSFEDLAAAHRALWLQDQLKDQRWSTIMRAISDGLAKGGKRGRRR